MFGVADVYIGLIIFITILLSFPALLIALNLFWPHYCQRTAERLTVTPIKSFFFGLLVLLIMGGFTAVLTNIGPGQALALLSLVFILGLGTLGAAGSSLALAQRLNAWSQPASKLKQLVRGALLFELAALFPFVGWFLFTPLVGTAGIGAAIFAFFRWRPHRDPTLEADSETDVDTVRIMS